MIEVYQQSIINDIAKRISKMGMSSASAWQAKRLNESGALFEDILKQLSVLTGKSEAVLSTAFEQAGATSIKYDDAIYRAAGLNPVPLNLSPAMLRVLDAGIRKTNN
ncbi:MAG: phage minor capsid protein, partial [Smithella sp.]